MAYKARYGLVSFYFATSSYIFLPDHLLTYSFLYWPAVHSLNGLRATEPAGQRQVQGKYHFFRKYSSVFHSELVFILHSLKPRNFPYITYQNIYEV